MHLGDTAGLRHTTDPIESEGIMRGTHFYREADLRLLVLDASQDVDACLHAVSSLVVAPSLIVLNKCDLVDENGIKLQKLQAALKEWPSVCMSCSPQHQERYLPLLLEALEQQLAPSEDKVQSHDSATPLLTRARHRHHLQRVEGHLQAFACVYSEGAELAAEELRQAVREMARVAGHANVEDVLDSLFSEFCIGK